MATILSILGTSTPVSEALAGKLGYVKAAIACRVFFYQQLKRGVCDASVATLAQKLGMSTGCVSTNLKWLIDKGYIKELSEHHKGNVNNSYQVTDLFYDTLERSLGERNVHEMNDNVHEMNGEEESKEELKNTHGEAKNGKTADYLDRLPTYQPGKEQVAQPDGFQRHFGYRQEILQAYNEETNLVPNQGRKAILAELAARPTFDLEKFKTVLHKFNVGGGNPYDIESLVKSYDEETKTNGKPRKPILDPRTGEPTGAYYL